MRNFAHELLRNVAGWSLLPHRFRIPLLRSSKYVIGHDVLLYGGGKFAGDALLTIEDDVFINTTCYFDLQAPITIHSGARVGNHVQFITSSHVLGSSGRRAAAGISAPIRVGRGVWVGAGATVLPGVELANGSVIAAGAVVVQSTEPNTLYGGVPAKRIRELSADGALEDLQ